MLPATPAARLRGLRTGPASTSTVISVSRDQPNAVLTFCLPCYHAAPRSATCLMSVAGPTVAAWRPVKQRSGGQMYGSGAGTTITWLPLRLFTLRRPSGSNIRSAIRSLITSPACSQRRNRLSASSARRLSMVIGRPYPGARRRAWPMATPRRWPGCRCFASAQTDLSWKSVTSGTRADACRQAKPARRAPAASHRDDDLPGSVALLEVPDSLRHFGQGVSPVDDRSDLPLLEKLAEDGKVGSALPRQERKQPLADYRRQREQLNGAYERRDPLPVHRATDGHQHPVTGEYPPALANRLAACHVDERVITLAAPGEVFLCVIDDMVRAERPDQLHLGSAADAGHLGAERFGDLHSEGAYAACRPVDQNFLLCLDPSLV